MPGGFTPTAGKANLANAAAAKKAAAQKAALALAIAAQKRASAAKIPKGTQPVQSPTQLYNAAGVNASQANTAYNSMVARNAAANSPAPAAASYSAPPPAYSPPPPPAAVAQTATAAPATPAATPVTVGAEAGANNTTGESFTRTGGGTFGQFERQRQNRGPRTGTSITPEMLQRIARQRFAQQR